MDHAYAPSRTAAGMRMYSGIIPAPGYWEKGIHEQALNVFAQIEEALAAEGLGLENLIYVTGYLDDPTDFEAYDRVWRQIFPDNPPARTTVAATILVKGPLLELSVTAAK